jgi:hypothetical protein
VLDLRKLAEEFVARGDHSDPDETVADTQVINAIKQRDLDPGDREKHVVDWLNRYRVLMFFPPDRSKAIADQIMGFADELRDSSLQRDRDRVVSGFNRLERRISEVAPHTKTGKTRVLTSLTSKALWCCYPDDVPIFDNNAVSALRLISRLCRMAPGPKQSEYASFVEVWFRVYNEVEPVISLADLSNCPYKVRVLDRLLWYLGQGSFYDGAASPAI